MKIKRTETTIYEINEEVYNDFFSTLNEEDFTISVPDPIRVITLTDREELQEYIEDPDLSGIKLIKSNEIIEKIEGEGENEHCVESFRYGI